MALKVGGTSVFDNTRALQNIATVDATTAASITAAGVGGGGAYDFVASGAISSGDVVVLNNDGTVSVAGNIYTAIDPPTVGTPVAHGVTIGNLAPAAAYDTTNQKVVIVYDDGTSNSKAVVGTINGASITFGTPATFYASGTNQSYSFAVAFDPSTSKVVIAGSLDFNLRSVVGTVSGTSISFGSSTIVSSGNGNTDVSIVSVNDGGKVVFAWRDSATTYGYSRVGTISGTSISFGTAVAYNSASSFGNRIVYDSNANKLVVCYENASTSRGVANIGTVSGTSISFGYTVEFSNGSSIQGGSNNMFMGAVFDNNANKVVVFYRDGSNNGLAAVGTVSGTSTSWGTPVTIATGQFPSDMSAAFDNNANQVGFFWRGTSGYGRLILGEVGGTSITLGTEVVFENALTSYISSCFDSAQNKFSVTYRDEGNANALTTAVVTASTESSTANNWIGISTEAIADTATGPVTIRYGTNDQQTGLTIGSTYYVADDGSLTTTDTGRKIGKALATDTLLITEPNS